MKIDAEKFPALFDDNLVLKGYKHLLEKDVFDIYRDIVLLAKQNLFFIAQTIMTPVLQAYSKLIPFRSELTDSERGLVFISKRGNPHVFLYALTRQHDGRITILCQVSCMSGDKHFGSLFAGYLDTEKTDTFKFYQYNYLPLVQDEVVQETVRAILANELFINFAEVETKEIQPNRQIWEGPRAVYNNKTKLPITIVDSTWYTNLISSGAFKVRGHFRMQPYGHGLTKRKFVWINDFEKEGYTRKAKIENI
jgi:hypothetical protein